MKKFRLEAEVLKVESFQIEEVAESPGTVFANGTTALTGPCGSCAGQWGCVTDGYYQTCDPNCIRTGAIDGTCYNTCFGYDYTCGQPCGGTGGSDGGVKTICCQQTQ